MFAVRRILHPTDFSPQAELAFQAACDLARKYQASLVLLHVTASMVTYGELETDLFRDPVARQQAEEQLQTLMDPSLSVESYVVEGGASTEIVQAAKDKDCDLIVMGSHGRRGITRLLLGSVAQDVLRKAPCPVLVIKPPASQAGSNDAEKLTEEPATSRPLASLLSEMLHVLKAHARETEKLTEHVERYTGKLPEPSQIGLVIAELIALEAHLDGALTIKS